MPTCVQIQFKSRSRQIGKLLSNCLSNMRLVKASLKNALFFLKKCLLFFSSVKTAVTFRALCIASLKLLLSPSLRKLLFVDSNFSSQN